MHLDNGKLKQGIFLFALFALGGFLLYLLRGFVSPFLGALVFYILLRRPLFYLTEKARRKWPVPLAVSVLLVLSFVVLVLPVLLVSLMLSGKVGYMVNHYQDILVMAQQWSEKIKAYLGVDLLTSDSVNKLTSLAANALPGFLSATFNAIVDIFVQYFLLFFMLMNARALEAEAKKYLPFDKKNNQLLLRQLNRQTVSNSIGIAALAVMQTIVALIGYSIAGLPQPFFWAVLTGISSVVPAVGTGLVWIPACLIYYASGRHGAAIFIGIYSAVVMSVVENVFRLVVIRKLGDVHPLITFFGILLGIDLFGFVGIIFGPMVISYFILLLQIYRNEYLGIPHQD
ncbi:MAG TPA: AI-2E family transporter [Chitinophagales bacterium]|nr:AI-2E family transporter [Chitinophagales bacterium]